MGTYHTACVFYGTWVPRRSDIGERLMKEIDDYGGTPCPTGITGVVLDVFGCAPTGNEQIAIYASESAIHYDPRADTPAPRAITDRKATASWTAVLSYLQQQNITTETPPLAPLGWHFAARSA